MNTYSIICWHNSATEGDHQRVLFSAKTLTKVLRDFERYLSMPERMRSFNKHNLIQLHHIDRGVIACFPAWRRLNMTTLQQSAELNWPEDEATSLADFALDLFKQDGHDYYHKWLMNERDHFWNKVFNKDVDLMNRFSDLFNQLTAKTTNLYI